MLSVWGAASMAVVIALGAFGAHGLKAHLSAEALGWWHTGVLYQALHGLGFFAADRVRAALGARAPGVTGIAFAVGTLLFSGSLYAMALTDVRKLGMVTPIGGAAFIVGWVCLALSARRAARVRP
jgi:uncharacterized membrane protein YgdD (TMEM256/DUF423 family)